MPASSVSLSSISVTSVAPAARSAAAPGSSVLSGGSGAEHSFGQWMQEMQAADGGAQHADGEKLPEEGKTLPAQRQQDGARLNEKAEAKAEAGTASKDQAQAVETDKRVAGNDDGEEQAPAPNGTQPTEVEDAAAEGLLQGAADETQVAELKTPMDGQLGAEFDRPAESSAVPAELADLAETESGRQQDVAGSRPDSADAESSMPAQAARPDVREAALQNRGQTGEGAVSSADNHGQQVSAIAREQGRGGETQVPEAAVTPVPAETDGEPVSGGNAAVVAQDASSTGVAESVSRQGAGDVVEAVAGIEKGARGVEAADQSTPSGSAQQQDEVSVAPASAGGERQPVVDVEPEDELSVATAVRPTDAPDRMQNARDTVAKSDAALIAAPGAQRAGAMAGGESGGAGDQQQAGQHSQSRDPGQPVDRQLSVAGSGIKAAGAQDDSELLAASVRQFVGGGTEAGGVKAATASGTVSAPVAPASDRALSDTLSGAALQRLQDPAWGRVMGQRAVMMAQYGPKSAEIKLDPPELGAMQIRIRVSGQDQVSVSFSSPHPAVRDVIEQQMPRLREMFAEQGLELSQSSVSDQSANGRGGESSQARGQGGAGQYSGLDDGTESIAGVQTVAVGLVDYYA
ncbi:flagellar hook-length control protein FliK [Marinobacterium zhoushanense]|uniref:Flagellar hook-length control protein FliK n=1 Tax=Marinobacterium zhoushanense TaxID=1679163 RepID=A0ABQ1KT92_9GAMM|nr:flagellar hook-length control protein FliK [Marinobacterium zhoushanense]GGC07332.1 flagellar hook-length control protein FliK [Marinobacterium zhoushanense]